MIFWSNLTKTKTKIWLVHFLLKSCEREIFTVATLGNYEWKMDYPGGKTGGPPTYERLGTLLAGK